jgi:hypothetical protein
MHVLYKKWVMVKKKMRRFFKIIFILEHYAIRFIPRENGVHWVHVRFNGRDIPDSPFRVVVGHANADPGRVFASGPGLYTGETGKKTK